MRAHSSLSPFDNPMLKATVKRVVVKVAAGSVFAGLVIGWLAAAVIARMRAKKGGREDATESES